MPLPAASAHPTMQTAAYGAFPNGSYHAGQYTLIFQIRNVNDRKLLKRHNLIIMPQQFSQETESRTSLYYTKGGIVADTPLDNGVGATIFTIAGHTGYRGILWEGLTPVADRLLGPATPEAFVNTVQSVVTAFQGRESLLSPPSFIDGAAAVKDLQDTILAYFFPGSQPETFDVTQTQELQLEFLNLSTPTSGEDRIGRLGWVIHPHRNLVSLRQDATRPFLYMYQFQFAAIAPLFVNNIPDVFVERYVRPRTGFQQVMDDITRTVTDLRNGINTITDAFDQMVIQNFTGPISTYLLSSAQLGDALGNFIDSGAEKLRFPLYAQQQALHVLDAPKHSVSTLKVAAQEFAQALMFAADPRSIGTLLVGGDLTGLIAGVNDSLTIALNGENPKTLPLGTVTGPAAIASKIQALVRAETPQHGANASAYRDFTATVEQGQLVLRSGTKLSDAASVKVVVPEDPSLAPTDASATLGLGTANGGQEHQGSSYPLPALALLRGMERACTQLLAFPDFFADQLETQDAALAQLFPPWVDRAQIRGDQRMQQTRVTPGDSLQGIAARVGLPWETLALVNHLTYPYILEEPTTLRRGRVSSADHWSVTDATQAWPTNAYQGQRVDIVAGAGTGQSRRIVRSTATQLVLEQAWSVVPNDTSDYAIRSADNPIVFTGTVSAASTLTVTDSALALVPGSQRGRILLLASGAMAGARRQVSGNTATTYSVTPAWEAVPSPGSIYVLLGPAPSPRRQKLIGETLSVPHPSGATRQAVRGRLQDVSAITGQVVPLEEQLFGRDLSLRDGALVWEATRNDLSTIAGLPNLREALIRYINLPLGELEYAPNLGSYVQEEIGISANVTNQLLLLESVHRTIRQDKRIARMGPAQLHTQSGLSLIAFNAVAIDGSSVDRIVVH